MKKRGPRKSLRSRLDDKIKSEIIVSNKSKNHQLFADFEDFVKTGTDFSYESFVYDNRLMFSFKRHENTDKRMDRQFRWLGIKKFESDE